MTSSDRSDLTIAIEQLKAAASRLPSCERAAKLKGLILRLERQVAEATDVSGTVTRLMHATELALDHDPWMQLDRIAQCLSHEIFATDPSEGSHDLLPDGSSAGT
jgi:hypothetical protein